MLYSGIDLHQRTLAIHTLDATGTLVRKASLYLEYISAFTSSTSLKAGLASSMICIIEMARWA